MTLAKRLSWIRATLPPSTRVAWQGTSACVCVGGCGWVRVVVVASIVWCVLHLVPFHGSVFISCVGCRFFDLLAPLSRLSGDVHSDWDHVRRRWRTSHKPLALTGKVLCFGTIEGTA